MKSETAVLFAAVVTGFVLVPPLARANPTLVNGFLFLILFGSLLQHRDIWLPYLATVGNAASGSKSSKAQGSSGVLRNGAN